MKGPVLYEDRLVRRLRSQAVARNFKLLIIGSMGFVMLSVVLWTWYLWG